MDDEALPLSTEQLKRLSQADKARSLKKKIEVLSGVLCLQYAKECLRPSQDKETTLRRATLREAFEVIIDKLVVLPGNEVEVEDDE